MPTSKSNLKVSSHSHSSSLTVNTLVGTTKPLTTSGVKQILQQTAERCTQNHDEVVREDTPGEIIQDFVPVYDGLEWQFAASFWRSMGTASFTEGEVPYVINNSGRLSLQSAELLFAHCETLSSAEAITVLELGSGTGLFAKYLLDQFKRLCANSNVDYYERLTFYVTEYSSNSIKHWQERGQFFEHGKRVVLAACDANEPTKLTLLDGSEHTLNSLDMVFCNYILDVLPSTVVKKLHGQWQELEVAYQTQNSQEAEALSKDINAAVEALRAGQQLTITDSELLLRHTDLLVRYRPLRDEHVKYLGIAENAQDYEDGMRFVLNFAAIASLHKSLNALKTAGLILINDYGATDLEEMQSFSASQRFGATLATGLNFVHLADYFEGLDIDFLAPTAQQMTALQPRLIGRDINKGLRARFLSCFCDATNPTYHESLNAAREAIETGNTAIALNAFTKAIELNPYDWSLIGEVADFLILEFQEYESGTALAQTALHLNPWYSAWLWNILGDGLYCQDKLDDAHEAYLNAQSIAQYDPRTNLNLAYSFLTKEQFQEALLVIAVGLAHDVNHEYRSKLLDKQEQVLAAIDEQQSSKHESVLSREQQLSE